MKKHEQKQDVLTWRGLRIIAHPLLDGFKMPVLRVRDDVPCAEPFRSQMNAWLLEMFGAREVVIITPDAMYASANTSTVLTIRTPHV